MKYIQEIWVKASANYIESFDKQFAPFMRMGFKLKRGEKGIPLDVVRDLVREAYRAGAESALKMAEEIDN